MKMVDDWMTGSVEVVEWMFGGNWGGFAVGRRVGVICRLVTFCLFEMGKIFDDTVVEVIESCVC